MSDSGVGVTPSCTATAKEPVVVPTTRTWSEVVGRSVSTITAKCEPLALTKGRWMPPVEENLAPPRFGTRLPGSVGMVEKTPVATALLGGVAMVSECPAALLPGAGSGVPLDAAVPITTDVPESTRKSALMEPPPPLPMVPRSSVRVLPTGVRGGSDDRKVTLSGKVTARTVFSEESGPRLFSVNW